MLDCKLILCGSQNVGKTCIFHRFAHFTWLENPLTTIGAAFIAKNVIAPTGEEFTVNIWDSAGQEKLRSLTRLYFKRTNAVLLCFDVTDNDSIDDLAGWGRDIIQQCEPDTILYVLANKTDLLDHNPDGQRILNQQMQTASAILEYEGFTNVNIYPVSAKTAYGIEQVFTQVIVDHVAKYRETTTNNNNNSNNNGQQNNNAVDLNNSNGQTGRRGGCCG